MKRFNRNILVAISLLFLAAFTGSPAPKAFHRIDIQSAQQLKDFFHYTKDRIPFLSSHRGGPIKGFPENCLATFDNTLSHTWSMMEMDPHYTKDSILVVMHDPTLNRTSDGHGKIIDYTYEELKKVRLKDPMGNVTGYGISTLDEVLEWAKGKTILVVDMKEVSIETRVKKIQEHHVQNNAIVIAYSFDDAKRCYAMDKNIIMEVMMPDKQAVASFDSTGVSWQNVVAFVTHTQPKDKGIFELIHSKGAMCIMGSSRSVDKDFAAGKIKGVDELEKQYHALISEGADIIEADMGIEAGAALEKIKPSKSSKSKYFKMM